MKARQIAMMLSMGAIVQAGWAMQQPKVPEAMVYNTSIPDLKEALTRTLIEQNISLQANQSLKNGSIRIIGSSVLEKVKDRQYRGPFGILLESPSAYWRRTIPVEILSEGAE